VYKGVDWVAESGEGKLGNIDYTPELRFDAAALKEELDWFAVAGDMMQRQQGKIASKNDFLAPLP
jgi:hypothetical protein